MKPFGLFLLALLYAAGILAQSTCPPGQDANQDGLIGVDDLMDLLSHWGDTDEDADGVYDSVDDCVGEYDECGVCNGIGAPCACQGPIYFENYTYEVVQIGDQCWFAENLRSGKFSNGDSIPYVDNSTWGSLTSAGYCVYANTDAYAETYGYLYNFYAASDERGLCPVGWHVATDLEWQTLESFAGMSVEDVQNFGWRGEASGYALKTNVGWCNPVWTNLYGFNGTGGGWRSGGDSGYRNPCNTGRIWTSTSLGESGISRRFKEGGGYGQLYREAEDSQHGYSVRCIKN